MTAQTITLTPAELLPHKPPMLLLTSCSTADGERVALTFKEFELLRLFLSHPGIAFTRDQLMEEIWGTDYLGESRTVDMHIRTLRQKLGKYGDMIETVRNVGYRLEVSQ